MQCKACEHFSLFQPMFVQLGWKFDKIAGDICPGYQRIGHVAQHAMQRMAKFMKERARIVETQEAGQISVAPGKIQNIDDDRLNFAIELLLLAKRIHPSPAALRRPCEIVADKKR